jgi:putative selenium metabolism protein SsnA
VSDRDGAGVAAQGLEENARFIEHCLQSGDSRLKGMFGLHASFTLSDRTLTQAAEYAARLSTGFHVHTAEAAADVEDSQRRYGKGVVERLHDFGIWGEKTVAAHCVHVSDAEIDLLLATKTNVVHNPESNMGNAVGCAPVLDMMRRGLAVGLGTDGYTCDMFESLKVANLLHKHQAKNPSAAWQEPPTMLFNNNPAIAAHYFEQPLGQLIPGAFADIIIVDYTPPTPISGGNLDGHILFGMAGRSVDTTIVNGKILMLDRQLTTVDEAEIYAKAREQACALWSRF